MNDKTNTWLDQLIRGLKNHRWFRWVLPLAVAVIAIGTFTDAVNKITSFVLALGKPSGLSIVDVAVTETWGVLLDENDRDDRFPILDIKLRNTGSVAVLKNAIFHVKKVWFLEPEMAPSALEVSWTYNVELSIYDAPYSTTIPISQEVPAGRADRFDFVIGNDALFRDAFTSHVFLFDLELIYDEEDRSVRKDDILVFTLPAAVVRAFTLVRDPRRGWLQNWRAINDIRNHLKGATTSDQFREWVSGFPADLAKTWMSAAREAKSQEDKDKRIWYVEALGMLGEDAQAVLPKLRKLNDTTDVQLGAALASAIHKIETNQGVNDPIVPLRESQQERSMN